MNPEDRQRIEAIRAYMGTHEGLWAPVEARDHMEWLLELVERQEDELERSRQVIERAMSLARASRGGPL